MNWRKKSWKNWKEKVGGCYYTFNLEVSTLLHIIDCIIIIIYIFANVNALGYNVKVRGRILFEQNFKTLKNCIFISK